MIYEEFLTHRRKDFKGRTLKDIWSFSDQEIENTHDFVQIIFPLNKPSQSVFHGYFLDTDELVNKLKNEEVPKQNYNNNTSKTKIIDTINQAFLYNTKIKAQQAVFNSSKENIKQVKLNG